MLKMQKFIYQFLIKKGRDAKIEKMNSLKGYIKSILASKINHLRHMPDIDFYLDDIWTM